MVDNFLQKLQDEARLQQKLYSSRILPKKLDSITSFIGEHTLFSLTLLSLISASILEIIKRV